MVPYNEISFQRSYFLLLAFEDIDALMVLKHQAVRAQLVDVESILVQQELAVQNLPCGPRIGFSLDIVLYFSTLQEVEVFVE